jgi:phage virion morphogenesis protein
MVQVATYLRRSQAERIAAQRNPDGSPYEPRKPRLRNKKGAIRRTMFEKLRQAKRLRKTATAQSATVTIGGRSARIARVHQYGLRDKVDWAQAQHRERQVREARTARLHGGRRRRHHRHRSAPRHRRRLTPRHKRRGRDSPRRTHRRYRSRTRGRFGTVAACPVQSIPFNKFPI